MATQSVVLFFFQIAWQPYYNLAFEKLKAENPSLKDLPYLKKLCQFLNLAKDMLPIQSGDIYKIPCSYIKTYTGERVVQSTHEKTKTNGVHIFKKFVISHSRTSQKYGTHSFFEETEVVATEWYQRKIRT